MVIQAVHELHEYQETHHFPKQLISCVENHDYEKLFFFKLGWNLFSYYFHLLTPVPTCAQYEKREINITKILWLFSNNQI